VVLWMMGTVREAPLAGRYPDCTHLVSIFMLSPLIFLSFS